MPTILVVDDRPTNRDVLVTILGYREHRVLQAGDGAEALQITRTERPDLIISDILMPTMDGFEFVRQLRADPGIAQTKVIFYTADYLKREAQGLALSCGVGQIITKPAEPHAIYEAVDTALGIAAVPVPVQVPPAATEFSREHLSIVTNKLATQADELRSTNERLTALIELAQEQGQEKDIVRLLENFCAGARKIIGAKYAAIGTVDSAGKLKSFTTSGLDAASASQLRSPVPNASLPSALLKTRSTRNVNDAGGVHGTGLPPNFPTVHSFLGATISSLSKILGWVCFADKIGVEQFTPEDERLASVLSSQLGRIYENGSLYSELKRKVAELSESEAQKTAMLDASFDGIITLDAEGKVLEFNPAAERTFGYTQAEIAGKDITDLLILSDSRATHGLDRYLKTEAGSILDKRIELFAMRAGGTCFPIEWVLTRIKQEGPAVFIGFVRNITERKQAERELHECEGRFRQIAENIHEVFFLVDHKMTRILYISPAYEEIWGKSCQSLYDNPKSWAESIHPDELERVQKAMMPKGILVKFDIEFRIVRPDKSIRWIRCRSFPIRSNAAEDHRVAGICEDITHNRQPAEE